MAPTDRYTPPLMVLKLLLIERTSFRSCLFSGLVNVDLSTELISSNRVNKRLASVALAVSATLTEVGVLSEAAMEIVGREIDRNNAVAMVTVSFFM